MHTLSSRRFDGDSHLENRQTELPPAIASVLSQKLSDAARTWWHSVVAEPHSFNKPTFYLGRGNSIASNVLAAGAHERTPGNVTLLAMGATGFKSPGDRACYKVQVGHFMLSIVHCHISQQLCRAAAACHSIGHVLETVAKHTHITISAACNCNR
jgi:hypothetical protein